MSRPRDGARWSWIPWLTVVSIIAVLYSHPPAPEDSVRELTVRGRVHCVDSSGRSVPAEFNCLERSQRFAFRSDEGRIFVFGQDDPRAGIFRDPRVRSRYLQIVGRMVSDDELEIIHLHAVEDGQLVKLYYRCEICNITAFAPGPCWCCQQEFEFRESIEVEENAGKP